LSFGVLQAIAHPSQSAAVPTPSITKLTSSMPVHQAAALLPEPSLTPLVGLTSTPAQMQSIEGTVGTYQQTLRLRALPELSADVLGLLEAGASLKITGRSADSAWYRVEAGSEHGWVMAMWITAKAGSIPIIDPPTPYTRASDAAIAEPEPSDDKHLKDYLYISGIDPSITVVLSRGLKAGNRLNVFAKVGDSITANKFFLVPIGSENYDLRRYQVLAPVIDYYLAGTLSDGNPFAHTSLAATEGWTIGDLLNPKKADSKHCLAGETPLDCEYRISKPAVALILIGTNDLTQTNPDDYEIGLRKVIETSLADGIIPIVSTVPPYLMDEKPIRRVHEYNGIIARLAEQYKVPLWDYWAAMNLLPNYGLWDDGIHPNWNVAADFTEANLNYGMTVRNLTALQALDAIWRALGLDEASVG
jgi:hypothetical protein